jgi:lysophospholipase L1-like esterase
MADRHIMAGDSIVANFTWPETMIAQRGGGATLVARAASNTINGPAYAGTTLVNGNAQSLLGAWSTRVGQYLGAAERLYILMGINDLNGMVTQGEPQSFNYETWRDAWRQVNVNILAASPRPSRIYVAGIPYPTETAGEMNTAPVWMRRCKMVARTIMDGITKDAAARYGWTWIPLATMHPSMQFDGIHPGPTGLTYYIAQTLAAG